VLKVQLEEAKIERQHKEECEAIRRLIAAQPPRAETQRQLNELEKELVGMEAENFAASRTLELRKKQFGLLLHVVDELQSTLEEEKNPVDPDVGMVGTSSVGADGSTSEPMVIDT
jgi:THO complex subunit 7